MIIPLYAAILGLLFLILTIRVIKLRRSKGIGLGYGNDEKLHRAIAAQSNFVEIVPLTLILIYLLEQRTQAELFIHLLGALLIVGRICHAYGVSQTDEDYRFRVFGMFISIGVIISASLRILYSYL